MKTLILVILGILLCLGNVYADETYWDDFEDGAANISWQVKSGAFTERSNGYIGETQAGKSNYAIAITQAEMDKGYIQTTFQTEDVGRYENAFIVFGYVNNSKYYMVGARDGGNEWTVEKIENGKKTKLAISDETISTGIDYTIKAVFEEGTATLYVNGQSKVYYYFGEIPGGLTGLAVNNGRTYFDDVEIYLSTGSGIPQLIRFQGVLGDNEETPLTGTFTLTFSLYDVEKEGTALWSEVQEGIAIKDGLLDVELGSKTALDLPFDKQYWLGITVGRTDDEPDDEMEPRFKLTTVPYAFKAGK